MKCIYNDTNKMCPFHLISASNRPSEDWSKTALKSVMLSREAGW